MKKNYSRLIITFLLLPASLISCCAQKSYLEKIHRYFDISVGTGLVYNSTEKTFSPAIHLHFSKGITQWLGAGIGYEFITGDHAHHSVGLMASFSPLSNISLDLGPALEFSRTEETNPRLTLHSEIAYTFRHKNLFFGPMLDVGIASNDIHLGAGICLGFGIINRS